MDHRDKFDSKGSLRYLWRQLSLPESALDSVSIKLPDPTTGARTRNLASSFKIGVLAQSSIALTALLAALIHSLRNKSRIGVGEVEGGGVVPRTTVAGEHAVVEFMSERLYTLDGAVGLDLGLDRGTLGSSGIGGLHKSADGYVRVHDGFPVHRDGARRLLFGSDDGSAAGRAEVGAKIAEWKSVELETAAFEAGIVIAALRTYAEWDVLPQARAVRDFPIAIRKIADGPVGLHGHVAGAGADKCLRGLRVVEMSRVIATPVAGKTLAAHGADVLWVTSPTLPDQPGLDRDLGRGRGRSDSISMLESRRSSFSRW